MQVVGSHENDDELTVAIFIDSYPTY